MIRFAASVAAVLTLFLGVMYVRFSGDDHSPDDGSDEQATVPELTPNGGPPFGEPAPPGTWAMSLNIEPTANGQRVRPGDRVDILAANDGAGRPMTLVQNVEVLSIYRSSARPSSPEVRGGVTVALNADQAMALVEWREKASELLLAFPVVPD